MSSPFTPDAIAKAREARTSPEARAKREAAKPKHQADYASFRHSMESLPNVTEGKLDRFGEGNLRAAIELKCLECCQGDRASIRDCRNGDVCSLHPHRPYQAKD